MVAVTTLNPLFGPWARVPEPLPCQVRLGRGPRGMNGAPGATQALGWWLFATQRGHTQMFSAV